MSGQVRDSRAGGSETHHLGVCVCVCVRERERDSRMADSVATQRAEKQTRNRVESPRNGILLYRAAFIGTTK